MDCKFAINQIRRNGSLVKLTYKLIKIALYTKVSYNLIAILGDFSFSYILI